MVDMAYPAQFRKKLFSVKEKEGLTALECAKRFGVSKGSVLRWKNDQEPIFKRNRPAQKIDMLALAKDGGVPDSGCNLSITKFMTINE
jgi:transcriptional regulator with XRE-family HTH domain